MTARKHVLIWSEKNHVEHVMVRNECSRVTELGGTFEIVNKYYDGQWTSFITIYYPEGEEA